jgi:hypothetical protein
MPSPIPNLTLDWGLAIDPLELVWIDRVLKRIATIRRAEGTEAAPDDGPRTRTAAGRGR